MSKRLPPLNALRVFDAAARHLSFTRAADELFVTQAAVSHQIKSLEDFLGLKLFRRRNRSLLLTEEGQSYFQDIKEIFSQLTEATRKLQARSAKGALTGRLLPRFAIQWLVPRLSSFNSAYPGIDVRIQAGERQEDQLADDVDVAIFYGRGNWPGLRVEKLYAEYLLPVCSPLLLTGDKALKSPADLAQHTLLHDASRRDWQTYTRQLGLTHINVQQGPIFSHSAMVLQAAIHGQGVALANNVMAQSEIEAGRLVCPFNDVLVSKNAFYLVCHDSQAELGKIAAFRQWILAKAASAQEQVRFRYEHSRLCAGHASIQDLNMTSRFMLIFAAVSGFIFVALGAFGAHVLSKSLGAVEMGWIQTGLEYQAFHTLAIFGLAVAMQRRISIWFYWSSVFLALGTVLFSGSLYCLALSHLRLWAFVTPVGGVSFLAGWVLMFIGAIRLKRKGVVHE